MLRVNSEILLIKFIVIIKSVWVGQAQETRYDILIKLTWPNVEVMICTIAMFGSWNILYMVTITRWSY